MLSRRIDFRSNQFNLTLATSRTLTVNVVGEVNSGLCGTVTRGIGGTV